MAAPLPWLDTCSAIICLLTDGFEKGFWHTCMQLQPGGGHSGAGSAYRVEILANTELFPRKPSSYCHREHYTVVLHKKEPASVYIFQQPRAKVAVLTVASTPPIGEYGKQKVHYLTELSIENKRQYCAQHGFELVVAQNLAHGRTARWDKVMLLRRMLAQYEWSAAALARWDHTAEALTGAALVCRVPGCTGLTSIHCS